MDFSPVHVYLEGQLELPERLDLTGSRSDDDNNSEEEEQISAHDQTFDAMKLVEQVSASEIRVPLFTCGKQNAPQWVKVDTKLNRCVLHITKDLNANGILLKYIVDALSVFFKLRTSFSGPESYLTFRIICNHQGIEYTPGKYANSYPITTDVSTFMYTNSMRLPSELSALTRTSGFSSPFVRNPFNMPRPLVCVVPVMPAISVEQINESVPMQTTVQFLSRCVSKVIDFSVKEDDLRSILPTVLVDGVVPLYVWQTGKRKQLIIASIYPTNGKRVLSSSDSIQIFRVDQLQLMVTTNEDYDVYLVNLPPQAVFELMDYDNIDFIKGPNKRYNASVPVREWLYLTGKIPSRTICHAFKYALFDASGAKKIDSVTIEPGHTISTDFFCGYITSTDNTHATMQLLNSQKTEKLTATTGIQTNMCGSFVRVTVKGGSGETLVVIERFDEIPDAEMSSTHTAWDPHIVSAIYSTLSLSSTSTPTSKASASSSSSSFSARRQAHVPEQQTLSASDGSEKAIAYVTDRKCTCRLCEQLKHNGMYNLIGIEPRDITSALCVSFDRQTPLQSLLAFLFHRQDTFKEVKTLPPQQILNVLTGAKTDYINLRVLGLSLPARLAALVDDVWTRTSVSTTHPFTHSQDFILIGVTQPILAVCNVRALNEMELCSDGYSWFTRAKLPTEKHALVMLAPSGDVRKFVKILPSQERQYIHNGQMFVHSSAKCRIESTYSIPKYTPGLAGDTYHPDMKIPFIPTVLLDADERIFYKLRYTGELFTLSSAEKVFCRILPERQ